MQNQSQIKLNQRLGVRNSVVGKELVDDISEGPTDAQLKISVRERRTHPTHETSTHPTTTKKHIPRADDALSILRDSARKIHAR
jgi:hypothetical protein